MISETRVKLLFDRYSQGVATAQETQEFFLLVTDPAYETLLQQFMDQELTSSQFSAGLNPEQQKKILNHIFAAAENARSKPQPQLPAQLQPKTKTMFWNWQKLIAAAAVLAVLSIGTFFLGKQQKPIYTAYKGDLSPGSNKAILTLADGSKLSLSDALNGKLAEQSGISIQKTADGQLLYEVTELPLGTAASHDTLYNTISTPAGGQYRLKLPDGSRVWLNSASSLKYPVSFAAVGKRKVELKGEAYFEITKMNSPSGNVPFIVSSKGQEVEVLGTHFNVNSYDEEDFTATTLLEGSVKVRHSPLFDKIITPGEQARVKQGISVVHVDTTVTVAWKNGLFKFENASIYTIMNQFSRWYDVDVEYEGKIPANKFNGEVYRDMNVSKAFKLLSFSNIKFRIESPEHTQGRKKIVITQQ